MIFFQLIFLMCREFWRHLLVNKFTINVEFSTQSSHVWDKKKFSAGLSFLTNSSIFCYRPQTKLRQAFKVMLLHLCVILFGRGGGGLACQHASQVTWPASRGCLHPDGVCLHGGLYTGGSAYRGICIQGSLPAEGSASTGKSASGGGWEDPTGTRKAGGMYPTGILSCFRLYCTGVQWGGRQTGELNTLFNCFYLKFCFLHNFLK